MSCLSGSSTSLKAADSLPSLLLPELHHLKRYAAALGSLPAGAFFETRGTSASLMVSSILSCRGLFLLLECRQQLPVMASQAAALQDGSVLLQCSKAS